MRSYCLELLRFTLFYPGVCVQSFLSPLFRSWVFLETKKIVSDDIEIAGCGSPFCFSFPVVESFCCERVAGMTKLAIPDKIYRLLLKQARSTSFTRR